MDQVSGWFGDTAALLPGLIWNFYTWLFLAPLLLLSKRLRAWISRTTLAFGSHVGGAVAHYLGKHVRHAAAAPLSAYSYAHRALMDNATALLRVPSKKDRALKTDDVFVPLALEGSGRRIFHSEVLTAGIRLRISGEPGSGKSTIMKRLFRDECRMLRSYGTLWKAKLPVLIELRHVRVPKSDDDDKLAEALMAYVKQALNSVQNYRMDECLEAYLRKRGLLLLLDGADETQSSEYPRIERAIIALSDQLARNSPNSQIVLTMRSQFETRLGRELREEFPVTFAVQRFTPSDIFQFLRKWPFVDNRDARVSRIYGDLVDRPNLREMCTNPLVLSMYTTEDEARNLADLGSSPAAAETRTEFYRDVVDELLVRRRESQIGRKEASHLFRDKRYRTLGRIAYEHLSDASTSANRVGWIDAVAIIRDVQSTKKEAAKKAPASKGENDDQAIAYLDDLCVNTGIIAVEQEGETLRFIHLTFCEFMAAHYISQYIADGIDELCQLQQRLNGLNNAATRSRLNQVFPFTLGLVRPVDQPKALDAVERIVSDDVLAAIFLETKAYAHPAWLRLYGRVMHLLAELATSPDPGEFAADMHILTVLVKDAATHGAVTEINGRSFEEQLIALSQGDGLFLRKLLEGLSGYDAVAAFRVARACGLDPLIQAPAFVRSGFEQPAFALFGLEQMRQDEDRRGSWIALALEAGLAFPAANQVFRNSDVPAWARSASALASRQSWTRYVGPNFLGWLLDQAYYGSITGPTGIIDALRYLPKPSSFFLFARLAKRSRYLMQLRLVFALYAGAFLVSASIFAYEAVSHLMILEHLWPFSMLMKQPGGLTPGGVMGVFLAAAVVSTVSALCLHLLEQWSAPFHRIASIIFSGSEQLASQRLWQASKHLFRFSRIFSSLGIYTKVESAAYVLQKNIATIQAVHIHETPDA